jgi:uncharacterized protein
MCTADDILTAARAGDATRVGTLLDDDPSLVNVTAENGDSLLIAALYRGHMDVVNLVRTRGADLNIWEAAAVGDIERVVALLDADPSLVRGYSHDGWTPLHLAAYLGYPGTVEALVARGADVTARSRNDLDNEPLHTVMAGAQVRAVVETLIAHGANVNARQHGGYTPLHEAAGNGNLDLAELLLARGADVNALTDDGKSPLALAAEQGHAEIVALLGERGAEP